MTRLIYLSMMAALSLATLSLTALNGEVYGWSIAGTARGAALVASLEVRSETPVVADSAAVPSADPVVEPTVIESRVPIATVEPVTTLIATTAAEPATTSNPPPDLSEADAPKRPAPIGGKMPFGGVATR